MQIFYEHPLKDLNSFAIDVLARRFAVFKEPLEVTALYKHNEDEVQAPLVLGGGSNVLFTRNYDGLVLKNEISGMIITGEDEQYVYVTAGAGENWHQFVLFCVQRNIGGVENLSLIPGSVGASPIQNIGAYGVEIKDVFHELEAFDLLEKKLVTFGLQDCKFGYRDSIFKSLYRNRFVICTVTFRLLKKPAFNIEYGALSQELKNMGVEALSVSAVSNAVIRIRQSKLPDPREIGNAGSFFKNPEVPSESFERLKQEYPAIVGFPLGNGSVKLAAGWLIEQCGWKGFRRGDTGCHARQALVLVNYGNATGQEILNLSQDILDSVRDKFGVVLEREVNVY